MSETIGAGARLRSLLGMEAGEERNTGLMAFFYFLLSAAFVFIQTTAYGLFIAEFGARNLPFAYISVAVLASLLAYGYLRLSRRLPFQRLLYWDLAFLTAVCLVFWLGLGTPLSHWFVFFLPFWFQAIINLANLAVWPLAGRLFDVRQAKRLFGLVGAGNWVANIVLGGLVVAPLLSLVGPADLYLFAAAAVVAGAVVLRLIFRRAALPAAALQPAAAPQQAGRRAASPFAKPYNRLIFAYVLLWWVAFCFVDNIFYDRAGAMFPEGARLAAFIGQQLSVIGIIALITSLFLTGRIVRRYGLRTGLLAMPAVVIALMLVLTVAGALGVPAEALFWIAVVAKTFNVALGFSLSQAAGTLLYQPILGHERNTTQTVAEGIVQPAAIGLAGLLLLLFNTALHFSAVQLSIVFLVIGGAWLAVILGLARRYPHVLSEALVKRSLGESTSLILDPAGVAQLRAGLRSRRPEQVLYAIGQLEQLEPQPWHTTLREALPDLLAHPAPAVRSVAVQRILSSGLVDMMPAVERCLAEESNPQVRLKALRAVAALGDGADQAVRAAWSSPSPASQQAVLAGLLASGEPARVERARGLIGRLAGSSDPSERLAAAEVLAEVVCPDPSAYIGTLLVDADLHVRQAAVRAAGRQDGSLLIKELVDACQVPETGLLASEVLASKGSVAVPAILAALEPPGTSPAQPGMFRFVRLLGLLRGNEAVQALEARIATPDAELRLETLQALSRVGFRLRSRQRLAELLRAEVAEAAWLSSAMQTLAGGAAYVDLAVLNQALEQAWLQARRRILLLLSLGLEPGPVLRALQALNQAGDPAPAFAVEAVDVMLPPDWKPLVLPLLEAIPHAERLRRWQAAGIGAASPSLESLVRDLVTAEGRGRISRWATVCALHVAGVRQVRECEPAARALADSPDAAISEISCWSLAEMGFDVPTKRGAVMLSLVEKVLALKTASLFRETPDAVLADVADQVEEVAFDQGETIFQKGDRGDSLYIIVSGRVDVRDGDRLLNQLGEGAIFGELALLDPAPRSATITAVEPTHLLRLNEAHFQTVLAERPEVATAIIHVLTSYIRSLLDTSPSPQTGAVGPERFEP